MQTLVSALGHLHRQRTLALILLMLGLLVSIILGLAIGPFYIPVAHVFNILLDFLNPFVSRQHDFVQQQIIGALRAPRVLLGLVTGAALAVAGACFQALFRNPLADPAVIGVSAGASTAAVFYIVVGQGLLLAVFGAVPKFALPVAAMGGALLAVGILYVFVNRKAGINIATLLLAGIALNAFCSAVTGVLVFVSDDQQLRELTFWTLGSLARAQWDGVIPVVIWLCLVLAVLVTLGGALNALAIGESNALHLGIDVQRIKKTLIIFGAAAVGAAVAMTGIIGFVGLVVPHIIRLMIGADNRYVLPACAIMGALLLLLADMLARMAVQPAELPIGIITSLIGAPFFMYLLTRRHFLTQ